MDSLMVSKTSSWMIHTQFFLFANLVQADNLIITLVLQTSLE